MLNRSPCLTHFMIVLNMFRHILKEWHGMQFFGRGMIEYNIKELVITWVYNINNVNATITCSFEIVFLLWHFPPCRCQKFENLNANAKATKCHFLKTDFTIEK